MFAGPPLPLSPDFPLRRLLQFIHDKQQVGAWVAHSGSRHRLTISADGRCAAVTVGEDLGELLGCCSHLVLRGGADALVIAAEAVIRWRALQVVTGTPYLPSAERLRQIFPEAELDATGFRISTRCSSPEELLANCLERGVQVKESRIVYRM
jgi:hypothetical protein